MVPYWLKVAPLVSVAAALLACEKEPPPGPALAPNAPRDRPVNGYRRGDAHEYPEEELIDWLISRPDGSEEGNVVGKFLDDWNKDRRDP